MTSSPYSMGCIPSRSSVAPSDSRPESNTQLVSDKDINYPSENNSKKGVNIIAAVSDPTSVGERMSSLNPENQQAGSDEDMMSILMSERKEDISAGLIQRGDTIKARHKDKRQGTQSNYSSVASITRTLGRGDSEQSVIVRPGDLAAKKNNPRSSSFDDETDLNLLRQYIAVDYEIAQLEDRDALRMYHEKIEQLEQLERELDMISSEAEEVAAARGGSGMNKIPESSRASVDGGAGGQAGAGKTAICSIPIAESGNNSVISAESMSRSSWADAGKSEKLAQTQTNGGSNHANKEIDQRQHNRSEASNQEVKVTTDELNHASASPIAAPTQRVRQGKSPTSRHSSQRSKNTTNEGQVTNLSMSSLARYPTIEEVFNRKIILERERDKLKKEVEHVIVECDKLQSRYKRRDEILDKLFDGKKGNGLENHLEQQLNWLLEQKHYVDQVFYAWKRAETLTSQTCEQFASASEILKRLSNDNSDTSASQRNILVQSVTELLVKSRLDMDQAQKYNPNVDAPFFTDNETERFDKVIATLKSSQVESLTQNDFSQMMTVIQFAHKRAVSIRLWLEQILQTTIARDSFELAEEYKWIAIQLRKERINLIRHRLQESPYRSMARSIQEQMAQRQLTASHQRRAHEQQLNRDSGVESEPNDIDFEEEIYRLMVYLCEYIASTPRVSPSKGKHRAAEY